MSSASKRPRLSVDYDLFDFDTELTTTNIPSRAAAATDSSSVLFNNRNNDDDDDDEEPPLSWRLDETESLSDWTICVRDSCTQAETTYHVHRNILAVGPRKSEYFARLFLSSSSSSSCKASSPQAQQRQRQQTSFVELKLGKSKVEFPSSAAAAFPIMLDFMYHTTTNNNNNNNDKTFDMTLTSEQAVALRHLAKYFGVPKLFFQVANFIRVDLRIETAALYVKEAAAFHDDKILKVACGLLCGALTANATVKSQFRRVVMDLKPDTFHMVLTYLKLYLSSEMISLYVAEYLRTHKEVINNHDRYFFDLTSSKVIPRIDSSEALFFLGLPQTQREEPFCCCDATAQHSGGGGGGGGASLLSRCIASCSNDWKKVLVDPIRRSASSSASSSLALSSIVGARDRHLLDATDTTSSGSPVVAVPPLEHITPLIQIKLLQSALCAADKALSKKDAEIRELIAKKDGEIRELHVLVKDLQEIHCDIMERERGNKTEPETSHGGDE